MVKTEQLNIIVPVLNGASVISSTLLALHAQMNVDDRIAVIVNGTGDESAAISRAVFKQAGMGSPRAKVLELPHPSRTNALRAGEEALGTDGNYLYADQDSVISPGFLTAAREGFAAGFHFLGAKAVWRSGSPVVQVAMQAWSELPYVQKSPATAGLYCVSKEGRRRWSDWPIGLPDDKFARLNFSQTERARLESVTVSAVAPESFSELVVARRRYEESNRKLNEAFPDLKRNDLPRGLSNLFALPFRHWPGGIILGVANSL